MNVRRQAYFYRATADESAVQSYQYAPTSSMIPPRQIHDDDRLPSLF